MGNQKSLSFVVAFWTAIAIALSMGIYAVLQYSLVPNVTLSELLLNHLWHVLVLGAVIYLFLWLIFRNVLLRPLQQIYLHLYAVGTGRLKELVLPTTVREIQTLVEGVNLMIRRMEQGLDNESLANYLQEIETLRDLLKAADLEDVEQAGMIMECLTKLERAVLLLIRSVTGNAKLPLSPGLEKATSPINNVYLGKGVF